jgi:hypothetical protein
MLRLAEHVALVEQKLIPYRVLILKPEGKTPLGRPMCVLQDNIKLNLTEMDYIGLG